MAHLVNTKDLVGTKVWIEKPKKKDPDAVKKMGRVRACVFHPRDKRCVGFIVKRPDLALMFHRKDLFVAYNGYDVVDGAIVISDNPAATDKGACKALGVSWDECVLWVGLAVMCQDGTDFGLVGNVTYDAATGEVVSLEVTQGATTNALLGTRRIPARMIRGFRLGMGSALAGSDGEGEYDEEAVRGAILVDDEAKSLDVEGGLAEKAGEATAVVSDKAHRAIESAKPAVSEAAAVAGEAATKGAYATGRQIKRATHMFSDFKEEFDRASGKTEEPVSASKAKARGAGAAGVTGAAAASQLAGAREQDEQVEYVFVDEDGNEVEFVDEQGNVITDPNLIDEEFEVEDDVVVEAGAVPEARRKPHSSPEPSAASSTASKTASAASRDASAAHVVGSHLKKASGMFSAFKEEYDKARNA